MGVLLSILIARCLSPVILFIQGIESMNKQWLAVASGLIALVGVWLWLSGEPAPVETTATEAAPSESVGSATDPAAPEGCSKP